MCFRGATAPMQFSNSTSVVSGCVSRCKTCAADGCSACNEGYYLKEDDKSCQCRYSRLPGASGEMWDVSYVGTHECLRITLKPDISATIRRDPTRFVTVVASRAKSACDELCRVVTCTCSYDADTCRVCCVGPRRRLPGSDRKLLRVCITVVSVHTRTDPTHLDAARLAVTNVLSRRYVT